MAAIEERREQGPTLRVIEGGRTDGDPSRPAVVAEILADGTIRAVGDEAAEERRYAVGQVAGDGWTIWWDRRYW